ncbi:hypothetical protein TNCT_441221 [Trichonephila clavata]|uniref:Uncharacterized protein n=1 Tax=Trichonephila clavata TaxID=2740835 RepID=A0A8X6F899_TRICU|nr:hypothetical protein TNCT_441221 [Trichonephila clavata]
MCHYEKHPHSLKLEGYLKDKNEEVKEKATVLYKGCVRDVNRPHNTNMAAAAGAPNLGFLKVLQDAGTDCGCKRITT